MREEATQKIFDKIKPGFIFSGHSHYNCFYEHPNGNHPFSTTTFGAIPSSSRGNNNIIINNNKTRCAGSYCIYI